MLAHDSPTRDDDAPFLLCIVTSYSVAILLALGWIAA
jgi:hypothetical protein